MSNFKRVGNTIYNLDTISSIRKVNDAHFDIRFSDGTMKSVLASSPEFNGFNILYERTVSFEQEQEAQNCILSPAFNAIDALVNGEN